MSEFKDHREAYNYGVNDAIELIKYWVNKFNLQTRDQIYMAMDHVLEGHQVKELERKIKDAVRVKTGTTRLTENDEQLQHKVVQNEREKEMEISRVIVDQAREQATSTTN